MKLLLKDINTNKDEIPEKRLNSVSYNAIGSLLFLILIVADYSNDGYFFENISSFLTTKIVFYTFVTLLIINLLASVLRFVFMKLGKDFTFVNDVVLLVIVSAILIVNFVISLATPEKRLNSVSYNAIGSLLFLILIVADYSNDGYFFENISSFLTTKIVFYTFVTLLIINLLASVLRFVFMKLGKDFTFVNDVVLLVIVSAILIVNFVISLATSGFNFQLFSISSVFVLLTAYYVFKEIKKN